MNNILQEDSQEYDEDDLIVNIEEDDVFLNLTSEDTRNVKDNFLQDPFVSKLASLAQTPLRLIPDNQREVSISTDSAIEAINELTQNQRPEATNLESLIVNSANDVGCDPEEVYNSTPNTVEQ